MERAASGAVLHRLDGKKMDILDTSEAAAHVRLSKPTLERFRTVGGGPAFAKLGKSVRYRRSDLDDWLASRLVRSTSEAGA